MNWIRKLELSFLLNLFIRVYLQIICCLVFLGCPYFWSHPSFWGHLHFLFILNLEVVTIFGVILTFCHPGFRILVITAKTDWIVQFLAKLHYSVCFGTYFVSIIKNRPKSVVTALFGLNSFEIQDCDKNWFYWMGISIWHFYQPRSLNFIDFLKN